jgi:glycosyltransferase involved in cell wall biosynthesis
VIQTSFIVIAYNEEQNIARTLESILAQAALKEFEVIVVNDGSKDNTLEIVQFIARGHKAVRVVDLQPNQGRGAARAAGVAAAKGKYFAFVDADISLPSNWLTSCMPYMDEYDACGGTAMPDGDVAFLHGLLGLVPKAAPHTTTVTGSNGLFKREVFDKVSFDPNKKNGEDVALGYQILEAGFKTITVPGLLVDHRETKSFIESVQWLFVTGIGASRQFYEHREIRLPDLAFFGFVFVLFASIAALILGTPWYIPANALASYLTVSSAMHLSGKFALGRTPFKSFAALLINDVLLGAYYIGRMVGFATEWKK